jgi:signal transduction histidine kinase
MTGAVPFGRDPLTWRAWLAYEALVDRAFAPYGLTSLCQYDTRIMSEDLVARAHATHDRVFTSTGVEAGGQRRAELLAELAALDGTDPLELEPPVYGDVLTVAGDLYRFRAGLAQAPRDFVFAANEIATNALTHGRPPVIVRLHHADGTWLCVVTDDGRGLHDPYAGVDSPLPGNPDARGRGLWLARQLCERVTISTGADGAGTTVRLVSRS